MHSQLKNINFQSKTRGMYAALLTFQCQLVVYLSFLLLVF